VITVDGAILTFSCATFPVSALSSDFWHFSWAPSAKYKQAKTWKATAAALGFWYFAALIDAMVYS